MATVNEDVEKQPLKNQKEVKSNYRGCSKHGCSTCYSVEGNVVRIKCETCAQKAVNTLITQEWMKYFYDLNRNKLPTVFHQYTAVVEKKADSPLLENTKKKDSYLLASAK